MSRLMRICIYLIHFRIRLQRSKMWKKSRGLNFPKVLYVLPLVSSLSLLLSFSPPSNGIGYMLDAHRNLLLSDCIVAVSLVINKRWWHLFHRKLPPSPASPVQHSIAQYNAVQYNAVQYSTVQCSTVQRSTVQQTAINSVAIEKGKCYDYKI